MNGLTKMAVYIFALILVSFSSHAVYAQQCGDPMGDSYRNVQAQSNAPFQGKNDSCRGDLPQDRGLYGYQFQCVEFVRRFYATNDGLNTANQNDSWPKIGAAKDFYTSATALDMQQFQNGKTSVRPLPDDIIVFDSGTGFGHVAIIVDVTETDVKLMEQNWDPSGYKILPAQRNLDGTYYIPPRGKYKILGWLRKATSQTLFSDDFNDNSIDLTKWSYGGTQVIEQGGIMNVNTDATDAGGVLNSSWIPVNGTNPITVSRRAIVHYANNYFSGAFRMLFDTNGDGIPDTGFGVDHANNSYASGQYCSRYGFYIVANSFGWTDGSYQCSANVSSPVPAIWDTWFTEQLTYDPVTGILSYAVNGQTQTTLNVGVLPSGTNIQMRLYDQAWGWWTGHYEHFDDISVVQ